MAKIVNSTLTIKLRHPLNFDDLKKSPHVKKITKKHTRTKQVNSFCAVTWTKPITKETMIMNRNGKIVILGCKSEDQGKDVAKWILEQMSDNELEQDLVQHNIVAHGQFDVSKLNLDETLKKFHEKGRFALYEPELSAPIKYYLERATCLLFQNGKAILTGIRTLVELDTLIKTLESDLEIKFN